MIARPFPPGPLCDPTGPRVFVPAPDLVAWARSCFIEPGASLFNAEHDHLNAASIGALWTNVPNGRHMRSIVGQCELGKPNAHGKWAKARAELQLVEWFGEIPDFVLTFDAGYASQCRDVDFCSLVEHELYHAAQERDEFGMPKFRKSDGRPVFAIKGHDVEEFVGIVRRYGIDAAAGEARAFLDAAKQAPEVGAASIAQACGTCMLRAA